MKQRRSSIFVCFVCSKQKNFLCVRVFSSVIPFLFLALCTFLFSFFFFFFSPNKIQHIFFRRALLFVLFFCVFVLSWYRKLRNVNNSFCVFLRTKDNHNNKNQIDFMMIALFVWGFFLFFSVYASMYYSLFFFFFLLKTKTKKSLFVLYHSSSISLSF